MFFYFPLVSSLLVTGKEPHGIPWDDRDDLTSWEKESVAFYLEYSREVQHYLRTPRELTGLEEWSYFEALITHLDSVIDRSAVHPGDLIFRGVRDDFTKLLLFLLSVDPLKHREDGFHRITPQVIQDPGYCSFTKDARKLVSKSREDTRILFVHQTRSSDHALNIGGKDFELLYPRSFLWVATGFEYIATGTMNTVFISLEPFSGGM